MWPVTRPRNCCSPSSSATRRAFLDRWEGCLEVNQIKQRVGVVGEPEHPVVGRLGLDADPRRLELMLLCLLEPALGRIDVAVGDVEFGEPRVIPLCLGEKFRLSQQLLSLLEVTNAQRQGQALLIQHRDLYGHVVAEQALLEHPIERSQRPLDVVAEREGANKALVCVLYERGVALVVVSFERLPKVRDRLGRRVSA